MPQICARVEGVVVGLSAPRIIDSLPFSASHYSFEPLDKLRACQFPICRTMHVDRHVIRPDKGAAVISRGAIVAEGSYPKTEPSRHPSIHQTHTTSQPN
ncbi:hypothetical protein FJTKL_14436 [Diaporthe vaccinii]|uniref:Uncharacterized protein n=1 Tax=Diaporthe vaccinii TaxID=105482 RepID=A0ABR4E802_9PEZI